MKIRFEMQGADHSRIKSTLQSANVRSIEQIDSQLAFWMTLNETSYHNIEEEKEVGESGMNARRPV